jgi:hypothetical protein
MGNAILEIRADGELVGRVIAVREWRRIRRLRRFAPDDDLLRGTSDASQTWIPAVS